MMKHHAFALEADAETGIATTLEFAKRELGVHRENNPDIVILRFGLLTVEDARRIGERSVSAPFVGEHKVVIIAASRAYHEAQNALLKLFEEPPKGTYLFLILPSLGGLVPTLRSRVQILSPKSKKEKQYSPIALEFLKASQEKRSALIKKLSSGKDEDERRENREEAIAIVNGIEAIAYYESQTFVIHARLLEDIQVLRGYLYDRSAPVRMILEHLSLVVPKGLV